jgi:hypothetical protein
MGLTLSKRKFRKIGTPTDETVKLAGTKRNSEKLKVPLEIEANNKKVCEAEPVQVISQEEMMPESINTKDEKKNQE